ncbi:uncharacterized protein LOC126006462 [Suncus etruscus]|uniref:uncharacterized protein LOC126006462 n=1 Tax=Suncus etruscus TaxID=109475 RepID=UPI00210F7267|nr:uncharacterized protein LOC126006462 [Suncus etruscus]
MRRGWGFWAQREQPRAEPAPRKAEHRAGAREPQRLQGAGAGYGVRSEGWSAGLPPTVWNRRLGLRLPGAAIWRRRGRSAFAMHQPAAELGLGGAGEVADAEAELLPTLPAERYAGPSGDADSVTSRPQDRHHVFTLNIPFPSPLEAEIARGALAPDREPHRAAVHKELGVVGNTLMVLWRAENMHALRVSVLNFMDHLSLVLRTLQRFGPAFSR